MKPRRNSGWSVYKLHIHSIKHDVQFNTIQCFSWKVLCEGLRGTYCQKWIVTIITMYSLV